MIDFVNELNIWLNEKEISDLEAFLFKLELNNPQRINVRLVNNPGEIYQKYETELINHSGKIFFGFKPLA